MQERCAIAAAELEDAPVTAIVEPNAVAHPAVFLGGAVVCRRQLPLARGLERGAPRDATLVGRPPGRPGLILPYRRCPPPGPPATLAPRPPDGLGAAGRWC